MLLYFVPAPERSFTPPVVTASTQLPEGVNSTLLFLLIGSCGADTLMLAKDAPG